MTYRTSLSMGVAMIPFLWAAGALAQGAEAQRARAAQPVERTAGQMAFRDDIILVPSYELPVSEFISEEAKQDFRQQLESITRARSARSAASVRFDPENREHVLEARARVDSVRKAVAQDLLKQFPVTVTPEEIAGVRTDVIVPTGGVPEKHRNRVLLNVHGGGFIFGARWEGQIGSIPISATGGYKVIAIDYRMAPEHKFPAASEDVAKVYKELLKKYRPENIGIFGCSAGGTLTVQSVAWFQEHGLPRPGAIIVEGASVAGRNGDSTYYSHAVAGVPLRAGEQPRSPAALYFKGANMRSPLIDPTSSPALLAKFPPTLVLNALRDSGVSGSLYFHRQLVKAGVETELHVWEGMDHCFTYNARLPESREAYEVEVDFFDKHLGNAAK